MLPYREILPDAVPSCGGFEQPLNIVISEKRKVSRVLSFERNPRRYIVQESLLRLRREGDTEDGRARYEGTSHGYHLHQIETGLCIGLTLCGVATSPSPSRQSPRVHRVARAGTLRPFARTPAG